MHKRGHKRKTSPLIKNPQFSSNLADIQAKLPSQEVLILTKFHKDCKRIVDFLLTQKFLVCALFYASPFSYHFSGFLFLSYLKEEKEKFEINQYENNFNF